MSLTLAQARDDMLTAFKAAWGSSYPALYDDDRTQPPENASVAPIWSRVAVRHDDFNQQSLGAVGNRRFLRTGMIMVQVFTPKGEGQNDSDALVRTVHQAFEGVTTAGGVCFRNASIREIGPTGSWWQTNVTAGFEYHELR